MPISSTCLYTYRDGSQLYRVKVSKLIDIPIWNGNRILDNARVEDLKKTITNVQDFEDRYYAIQYIEDDKEIYRIIDGQHRIALIKSTLHDDFDVLIIVKKVENESDVIEYFNKINNVKSQKWQEDKNLIINSYVSALEKVYPGLIKAHNTCQRPYISSEKLREFIQLYQIVSSNLSPERFIELVKIQNKIELDKLRGFLVKYPRHREISIIQKCIDKNFALSYDKDLLCWMKQIKLAI